MKKILILLFIIGALTFVNVELFASSHTSYDGYDLDTTNQDLGVSLRDFFETNNLTADLSGSFLTCYQCYKSYSNGQLTLTPQFLNSNSALYLTSSNAIQPQGHYFYVRSDVKALGRSGNQTLRLAIGTTVIQQTPNNLDRWYFMSNIAQNTNIIFEIQYRANTDITDIYVIQNLYVINLSMLNIQPDVDLLDYYYFVYQTLKSQELAYDDGESDGLITGYNDGYSTGYDDGNLDGYNVGYDEGLFDYHTGNSYGQYDYTLSEPYNQATQANVSLLNIVSLIIGVVMSMIGFIINIDIFGISIASVLGTLAIGVGIIWLLKLIRG